MASSLAQFTHAARPEPPPETVWTWMVEPPPAPAGGLGVSDDQAEMAADPSGGEPARMFVEAIVQVESAGDPHCVGKSGERGLMQIKDGTWREMTTRLYAEPIDFSRAFEPELNREVGQAYLAHLERFLRSHRPAWRADMRTLLAASYNAGPNRVREADFDPRRLPPSTQDYARRVSALHDLFLAAPDGPAPGTSYALAEVAPRN